MLCGCLVLFTCCNALVLSYAESRFGPGRCPWLVLLCATRQFYFVIVYDTKDDIMWYCISNFSRAFLSIHLWKRVRLVLRFLISSSAGNWGTCWGSKGGLWHAWEEGRDGSVCWCLHSITWYGFLFSTELVHNSFLADLVDGHRIPNLTRSIGVTLQVATELWKSYLRSSPGRN